MVLFGCMARIELLILVILFLLLSKNNSTHVKVYHYTIDHWRVSVKGEQQCGSNFTCDWTHSSSMMELKYMYGNATLLRAANQSDSDKEIDVSVYNIHWLQEKTKKHFPAVCELPTMLTVGESEESKIRNHALFETSFKHYDGYSTTHPDSNIPRAYDSAYLNASQFFNGGALLNFSSLIKAGSYVASDCHFRESANSRRDHVVLAIRKAGFRVEGLGKCMHTTNKEGVTLSTAPNARYNTTVKKEALVRFMFNMAFENSIEDGYVTEKPFDALETGTVPVYLGDAKHLKSLLPHPKAAIFVDDYNGNYTKLAEYLNYLTTNETAYEEHRVWRKDFNYEINVRDKPLIATSWFCNVCRWAAANVDNENYIKNREKRNSTCQNYVGT